MANWKTLKLSELRLDQQNYRTGPQTTQRNAIRAIIEDQKQLLVNLAKDLLDVGPSPGEPLWVAPDPIYPDVFTVLEGNRRVAALKLLETPALADGTVVEDDFNTLSKAYAEKPIDDLDAQVFSNREEALPWIRRRHMTSISGVGTQAWKPMAKGRADREHGIGAPRSLAVFELLEDDSEEWAQINQALDNRWTTVDRVLDTKPLKDKLGVNIEAKTGAISFENGNHEAGKRLLIDILKHMASPSFKFSEVENLVDREKFIDKFTSKSVKALPTPKPVPPTKPLLTPPSAPAPKPKLDTNSRTTLAPKTGARTFQVNGVRLNSLYKECRTLAVAGNENAAALLLRVFIELSSEAILVEKAVPIPANAAKKGKTLWDDFGINLPTKIGCVLELLDPSNKTKQYQQIRVALDPNTQSPSSISTLHGYFHNRDMKPDATLVKEAWDAWELYLSSLHKLR